MVPSAGGFLVPPESVRMGLLFALACLLLLLVAKGERSQVGRGAALYGTSLVLRFLAGGASLLAMPTLDRAVRALALLLQGMAFGGIAVVFVFGFVLPSLRVRTPRIVRDLALALSVLGVFLWVLAEHEVDVTGLVATSAVVTAVIGFSLQDTLTNVMGGLTLQLDGSIHPGDWVRFGDTSGKVRELSWRYTSLETRNGDTLVVPNSLLIKSPVFVLGRVAERDEVKQRRWITFGVDHRHTPETVIAAVLDAFHRESIPHVADSPAPSCVLMDFKESWGLYAVRYWLTDLAIDDPTDSVVRTRVSFALRRAGIPMAIPAATLFTKAVDDVQRHRHEERDLAHRVAALSSIPLFAMLTEEERTRVAGDLISTPFATGEAMVVQGRKVHSLYVLTRGEAEVRVSVEGEKARVVSTMTAPDIFGEMGLLTGEPRRATVVALTEVECWKLDKERFQEVLEARPAIAGTMSRILAAREVSLAAAREGLSEEARRHRLQAAHDSILERIERFFGLAPAARADRVEGGNHA